MARKKTVETIHHTERGGGYTMPLFIRRIATRDPVTVTIGGEPVRKRWESQLVLSAVQAADIARFAKSTASGDDVKRAADELGKRKVEYAYQQDTDVWTCERREIITEGDAAPMIVEYGYHVRYQAWYWSAQPTPDGAANESRQRAAARDLEAAGLAPKVTEPAIVPVVDETTLDDATSTEIPGASQAAGAVGEAASALARLVGEGS